MEQYLNFKLLNNKTSIFVDKKVFEDIIGFLDESISGVKINKSNIDVSFLPEENNVYIVIDIRVSKNVKVSEKVNQIKNKIEVHTELLLGIKPKNIIINCIDIF